MANMGAGQPQNTKGYQKDMWYCVAHASQIRGYMNKYLFYKYSIIGKNFLAREIFYTKLHCLELPAFLGNTTRVVDIRVYE